MTGGISFALTFFAAIGSGLVGGVFFAFSTFVMQALTRLRPAQGIAAMQSINVTVLNRWFFIPFFGTAAACVALVVSSLSGWREPGSWLRLVASGLYLVGTILVTIVGNVPRNNALAAVDAESADGAAVWARYVPGWTRWNTLRTAAALAAATTLMLALVADRARS